MSTKLQLNPPVTVARSVLVVDTGAEASVGDVLDLGVKSLCATFCSRAFWHTLDKISAALSVND
jgi:hypothetical protein